MNGFAPDALYNALLLGVELWLVWRVRRARVDETSARILPAQIVLGAAAAPVGALLLAANTFHAMRLLAWLVFLHAPALFLVTGVLLRRRRWLAWSAFVGAVILVSIAYEAFLREPHALQVSSHHVTVAGAPRAFRIGVLADLQTDHVGSYERRVLQTLLEQKSDLILLPGDYIQAPGDQRRQQMLALRELFRELDVTAPLGVYAVGGNVDAQRWGVMFEGTHVTPLAERQTVTVTDWLSVTGLPLEESFSPRQVVRRPGPGVHVVMGHAPDFALGEIEADLLIAGHTHGGQVQLPLLGPIVTLSRVPNAWASGVTALPSGATLVVSRGVGMERGPAPRLRFLCPPEIVIVEVTPG